MRVHGLIDGGVTLVHETPPSRVTWMLPSSVPAHTIAIDFGLGLSAVMLPIGPGFTVLAYLPALAGTVQVARARSGEMRDHETASIGIEAALTGHLVLSTLHTNTAPGAITRLTEMGIEPFLVGSALDSVLAQRLARRLCSKCKEEYQPTEQELLSARFPWLPSEPVPTLHRPVSKLLADPSVAVYALTTGPRWPDVSGNVLATGTRAVVTGEPDPAWIARCRHLSEHADKAVRSQLDALLEA